MWSTHWAFGRRHRLRGCSGKLVHAPRVPRIWKCVEKGTRRELMEWLPWRQMRLFAAEQSYARRATSAVSFDSLCEFHAVKKGYVTHQDLERAS
jgi:hypothetical protein